MDNKQVILLFDVVYFEKVTVKGDIN